MSGVVASATDAAVAELMSEIERYLAAVDEFKRAGYPPHWHREPLPVAAQRPTGGRRSSGALDRG